MNRRERRRAFKQMGILKAMNQLAWNHPDRAEFRRRNREQGKAKHNAMIEQMEKEQYERLEHASAEYEKKCKKEGYNQEEIDMLLEAYALDLVRHKETWQEDKKRKKQLRKDALESKIKRLS